MGHTFTEDVTQFGANWLYSISGLSRSLGQIQRGPLYIHLVGDVTATGYYEPNWDGDGRVETPIPLLSMVADPSGTYWVSASGVDSFTVTFESTPIGDAFATTPYLIGHWEAAL